MLCCEWWSTYMSRGQSGMPFLAFVGYGSLQAAWIAEQFVPDMAFLISAWSAKTQKWMCTARRPYLPAIGLSLRLYFFCITWVFAKWLQYFFLFGLWLECLSIITRLLWYLLILTYYSAAQLLFLFLFFRAVHRLVFELPALQLQFLGSVNVFGFDVHKLDLTFFSAWPFSFSPHLHFPPSLSSPLSWCVGSVLDFFIWLFLPQCALIQELRMVRRNPYVVRIVDKRTGKVVDMSGV